jgi:putative transposase
MSKPRRLHAPGCVVHITARTQGHHPWFTEGIRSRINAEITAASRASGHQVIARAIMPNHFHMIVRQGNVALSHLMHRVMHRSAVLLRYTHKLQGHVFERRYWSGVCLDAAYVRAAILYTHLNPYRAGLCSEPADYPWSSHYAYANAEEYADAEDADCARAGLRFFAHDDALASARNQYLDHMEYQISIDRWLAGDLPHNALVAPRPCLTGDSYWMSEFGRAAQDFQRPKLTPSVCDVAEQILVRIDAACPMDLVRSGSRARRIATIRRQLIAALLARGFRGVQISRFFGVSDTLVSQIAVSLRA